MYQQDNTVKTDKDLFTLLELKADIVLAVVLTLGLIQLVIQGMGTAPLILLAGSHLSMIIMKGLEKASVVQVGCAIYLMPLAFICSFLKVLSV